MKGREGHEYWAITEARWQTYTGWVEMKYTQWCRLLWHDRGVHHKSRLSSFTEERISRSFGLASELF